MFIEVERVEEPVLIADLCAHHQEVLPNTVLDRCVLENDDTLMTFFDRVGATLRLLEGIKAD
jgi:hypothetical protein